MMQTKQAKTDFLLCLSAEEQNLMAAALVFYGSRGPTNARIDELRQRLDSAIRPSYVLYDHNFGELLTNRIFGDYQSAIDEIDSRLGDVIAVPIAWDRPGVGEKGGEEAEEQPNQTGQP